MLVIFHPNTGIPVRSFRRFAEDGEWLEAFLRGEGITVPTESTLAAAIDASKKLRDEEVASLRPPDIAVVEGMAFLARALQEAALTPWFGGVRRLLPHLVEANPIQNVTDVSTQPRNFVFELLVGACLLAAGFQVESHAEPDLILKASELWNLSLKAVYSSSPVTLMDNVAKATVQALRTGDGYALPVISVSNVVPHADFLPLLSRTNDIWASFPDIDSAKAAIEGVTEQFAAVLQSEGKLRLPTEAEDTRFRGVVLVVQTVGGILGRSALLTSVALLTRQDLLGAPGIVGPEHDLVQRFHQVTQTLLSS
jgi:hypothetical protein